MSCSFASLCDEVLEHPEKANELLPTQEGYFFGDTDYDKWYFEDVDRVREKIREYVIPEFDELENDETINFWIWY